MVFRSALLVTILLATGCTSQEPDAVTVEITTDLPVSVDPYNASAERVLQLVDGQGRELSRSSSMSLDVANGTAVLRLSRIDTRAHYALLVTKTGPACRVADGDPPAGNLDLSGAAIRLALEGACTGSITLRVV